MWAEDLLQPGNGIDTDELFGGRSLLIAVSGMQYTKIHEKLNLKRKAENPTGGELQSSKTVNKRTSEEVKDAQKDPDLRDEYVRALRDRTTYVINPRDQCSYCTKGKESTCDDAHSAQEDAPLSPMPTYPQHSTSFIPLHGPIHCDTLADYHLNVAMQNASTAAYTVPSWRPDAPTSSNPPIPGFLIPVNSSNGGTTSTAYLASAPAWDKQEEITPSYPQTQTAVMELNGSIVNDPTIGSISSFSARDAGCSTPRRKRDAATSGLDVAQSSTRRQLGAIRGPQIPFSNPFAAPSILQTSYQAESSGHHFDMDSSELFDESQFAGQSTELNTGIDYRAAVQDGEALSSPPQLIITNIGHGNIGFTQVPGSNITGSDTFLHSDVFDQDSFAEHGRSEEQQSQNDFMTLFGSSSMANYGEASGSGEQGYFQSDPAGHQL
ncbi:hypothetical protein BST61_g1120 [Cercospora zeina]